MNTSFMLSLHMHVLFVDELCCPIIYCSETEATYMISRTFLNFTFIILILFDHRSMT